MSVLDEEIEKEVEKYYYLPYKSREDWIKHRREVLINTYNGCSPIPKKSLSECLKEFDESFDMKGKLGEVWDRIMV